MVSLIGALEMHIVKVAEHIHQVDVEIAGIKNFIASYILKGEKAAIIETGPTSSIQNLLSCLKELKIKSTDIAYVAVSHIHLDHGGGVGSLLKHLPNAKVVVHQRGAPHLANPEKLWQQSKAVLGKIAEIYGKPEPVGEERIIPATDGITLDIGDDIQLKIIETLGHASHHLSYYEPTTEGVFPGDAAGIYLNEIDVVVPTTPAPFRLDIALASLDKLANLKPKILYYTHFGKAQNALDKIQFYKEQLKLWTEIAKQGIKSKDNLNTISKKIAQSDLAIQKAKKYIDTHMILSETVLEESVKGIVDYAEKFYTYM